MNELKITVVGDVMCGDSFYALGRGVASSLDRYKNEFLPPEVIDYFSGRDLVIGNIECVLSDVGRKEHSLRSLHMRGRPKVAEYLAEWGITLAHVANNHILEQGYEAAVDTVRQLEKAGIRVVGAGKEGLFKPGIQIKEVVVENQIISVIGICLLKEKYSYDGGGELTELLDSASSLAAEGKTVIVSVHWGDELMDRPSLWQRKTARQMVESGVSLIVGHHPHVVQGIETIDGGLVAYSLGNFVFNSFLSPTQWSLILNVTISGKEIIQWDYIPIEKDDDHRPRLAQEARKKELEAEIQRRCSLLKCTTPSDQFERQYQSDRKRLRSGARRELWLELAKRMFTLKCVYWPQLFLRPIQRRLGIW